MALIRCCDLFNHSRTRQKNPVSHGDINKALAKTLRRDVTELTCSDDDDDGGGGGVRNARLNTITLGPTVRHIKGPHSYAALAS